MHNNHALQIVLFEVQSVRYSCKERYLYLLEKRTIKKGGYELYFVSPSFFVYFHFGCTLSLLWFIYFKTLEFVWNTRFNHLRFSSLKVGI